MKPLQLTALLTSLVLLAGWQSTSTLTHIEPGSTGARLYDGIDRYHMSITSTSHEAAQWFDQGIQLMFGFNHDEAIRSFQEAAAHDPDAAMPWWGIAYSHGMNINDPMMTDERYREASHAAEQALLRINNTTPLEAALIHAVNERYSWPPPQEQRTLDEAYAKAMAQVWDTFQGNPDVGSFYAESMLNLQPWDYWTNQGEEKGAIGVILSVLESVLDSHPIHPGASHLYIHAVEASKDPDRAIAAANVLRDRIPGSGHLVHMPSHIYVRVGRYSDAADSNVQAIASDRAYFKDAPDPTLYWLYYAHNLHFLAYASMMESRYDTAIQAARELVREIPEEIVRQNAGLIEGLMPTTYHVMIRFGRWEEILGEPKPDDWRLVSRAVHHYARGIASSALGHTSQARAEHELFEQAFEEIPPDWQVFNNKVNKLLPIARAMLQGELAFREQRYDDAWVALEQGIEAEDALVYDEPPGWMLPVRHAYGALLMSAGEHSTAEAVYREDLKRNRNNGWSLKGLQLSLEAQGRVEEAAAIDPMLASAWSRADIKATSSCLCEP